MSKPRRYVLVIESDSPDLNLGDSICAAYNRDRSDRATAGAECIGWAEVGSAGLSALLHLEGIR